MIQHNHIITYAYFLFFQYKIQVGTFHHNLSQHYILFDRCQARWNFWSGAGEGRWPAAGASRSKGVYRCTLVEGIASMGDICCAAFKPCVQLCWCRTTIRQISLPSVKSSAKCCRMLRFTNPEYRSEAIALNWSRYLSLLAFRFPDMASSS